MSTWRWPKSPCDLKRHMREHRTYKARFSWVIVFGWLGWAGVLACFINEFHRRCPHSRHTAFHGCAFYSEKVPASVFLNVSINFHRSRFTMTSIYSIVTTNQCVERWKCSQLDARLSNYSLIEVMTPSPPEKHITTYTEGCFVLPVDQHWPRSLFSTFRCHTYSLDWH